MMATIRCSRYSSVFSPSFFSVSKAMDVAWSPTPSSGVSLTFLFSSSCEIAATCWPAYSAARSLPLPSVTSESNRLRETVSARYW
ncbi:hypothetical protein LUW77_18520 [Streptomyces radiopugnans]|nr:hypothetical protein LUW77_18520 [Streptomyces radiopugnans]